MGKCRDGPIASFITLVRAIGHCLPGLWTHYLSSLSLILHLQNTGLLLHSSQCFCEAEMRLWLSRIPTRVLSSHNTPAPFPVATRLTEHWRGSGRFRVVNWFFSPLCLPPRNTIVAHFPRRSCTINGKHNTQVAKWLCVASQNYFWSEALRDTLSTNFEFLLLGDKGSKEKK